MCRTFLSLSGCQVYSCAVLDKMVCNVGHVLVPVKK